MYCTNFMTVVISITLYVVQIDLPLSVPFYKWLLGLENTMTSADLDQIDPVLAKSFNQLEQILREKKRIEADCSHVSHRHLDGQGRSVLSQSPILI